jgi:hypothetical protein
VGFRPHRAVWHKQTVVSEKLNASIIKVMNHKFNLMQIHAWSTAGLIKSVLIKISMEN